VLDLGPDTADAPVAPGDPVVSMPYLVRVPDLVPLGFSNDHYAGYCERFLLTAALCLPAPNGLDIRRAALTEPMAVGLHAINKAALAPGDTALVVGCGPIGLALIAWGWGHQSLGDRRGALLFVLEIVWLAALVVTLPLVATDRWLVLFGLLSGFLLVWLLQAVAAQRRHRVPVCGGLRRLLGRVVAAARGDRAVGGAERVELGHHGREGLERPPATRGGGSPAGRSCASPAGGRGHLGGPGGGEVAALGAAQPRSLFELADVGARHDLVAQQSLCVGLLEVVGIQAEQHVLLDAVPGLALGQLLRGHEQLPGPRGRAQPDAARPPRRHRQRQRHQRQDRGPVPGDRGAQPQRHAAALGKDSRTVR